MYTCCVFFSATVIANFFEELIIIRLIRIYALSFIITGLSAVHQAFLIKNMKFRSLTIINIPGPIIGMLVGIGAAANSMGVWSIILMYLTSQFITSILLWLKSKWRPSLEFSLGRMLIHFNYGYKLLISGTLNIVFNNIYNVIIGKNYSPFMLGNFERATNFNQYPVSIITSIIDKVTFPLLANMPRYSPEVTTIYRKLIRISFFVVTPLMFLLAGVSDILFALVLGKKWLMAAKYFQILCLGSILYPVHNFNLNVLKIYGRSDLYLKLEVAKKLMIVLALFFAFPFGILALVWGQVIVSIISVWVNGWYSKKFISYGIKDQLTDLSPILFCGIIMYCYIQYIVPGALLDSGWTSLFITAISGGVVFIFMSRIFCKELLLYSLGTVKSYMRH